MAQLFSLGVIERFDFMKTPRHIIWPAILAVAGLAYWLTITETAAPQARIKIESDAAQIPTARPVYCYDYYFIAQNRTPEITVALH